MKLYFTHIKPYRLVDKHILPSLYFCYEADKMLSNDTFRLGVTWLGHAVMITVCYNIRF